MSTTEPHGHACALRLPPAGRACPTPAEQRVPRLAPCWASRGCTAGAPRPLGPPRLLLLLPPPPAPPVGGRREPPAGPPQAPAWGWARARGRVRGAPGQRLQAGRPARGLQRRAGRAGVTHWRPHRPEGLLLAANAACEGLGPHCRGCEGHDRLSPPAPHKLQQAPRTGSTSGWQERRARSKGRGGACNAAWGSSRRRFRRGAAGPSPQFSCHGTAPVPSSTLAGLLAPSRAPPLPPPLPAPARPRRSCSQQCRRASSERRWPRRSSSRCSSGARPPPPVPARRGSRPPAAAPAAAAAAGQPRGAWQGWAGWHTGRCKMGVCAAWDGAAVLLRSLLCHPTCCRSRTSHQLASLPSTCPSRLPPVCARRERDPIVAPVIQMGPGGEVQLLGQRLAVGCFCVPRLPDCSELGPACACLQATTCGLCQCTMNLVVPCRRLWTCTAT